MVTMTRHLHVPRPETTNAEVTGSSRHRLFPKLTPGLWAGSVLALLLLAFAICGPFVVGADPHDQSLSHRLTAPMFFGGSSDHPFGTDQLGRDMLVRIAVGLRFSVAIGLTVTLIAGLAGVSLGLLAATTGRSVDRTVTLLVQVQIAIPAIILAIAAVAIFTPGTGVVIGVLAASGWVAYQQVVRASTKSLLASSFVEASRSIGGSRFWIARKHLLPNAFGPIIIIATQQIAAVILFEAALSYLGLGVPSSTITLGGMVAQGRETMLVAWWVAALPGVTIALLVLALNLIGDGLRRRIDPRSLI